jgi:UDP-N-acetylglucosamine 3-dehydrogenase
MTPPSRTLGVTFLGCGMAAGMHSKTLRRLGDVRLMYASRDWTRAADMMKRFGGAKSFASYELGMLDPDTDVVFVTTPTASHRDLALEALQAGKHVIVEKPAFMRASDADLVRDAATAVHRQALVAENYFYKPMAEHLRRVIGNGSLGDVRFVSINATKRQHSPGWREDPSLSGGGALFEGGVHWINFASNIGLEVKEVSAAHRVGEHSAPDRSSLVVLRYVNGAVGTLAHSWELKAPFGGLRLSKVQGTLGSVTFESNGFFQSTTGRARSVGIPGLRDALGYRAMLADFLRALRGDAPPRFTLDMARRDLELLEEAERHMSSESDPRKRTAERPARSSVKTSATIGY